MSSIRPGEFEVKRLVTQLADAESTLRAAVEGQTDAVANPEGYAALLQEAQRALLKKLDELRLAHREAVKRVALLTAVLEGAPDVITQIDQDGRILFVNRSPTSQSIDEIIGTPWLAQAPEQERPRLQEALSTVFVLGESIGLEWQHGRPDGGSCWYSTIIAPVRERNRISGAVVISRDVTERKTAEAQLMVSDRVASMGTLAAGIAHEINNPLAAVITNLGFIQQALREEPGCGSLSPDVFAALDDSRSASDRVRLIVRDLKLFSRVDEDKRGPIHVERALESTLRMASNEIRHRARVVKSYEPVSLVEGNEARLGQVFLNLLVNAAQAIPEGNQEGNTIQVSTSMDSSGRVVVSIRDTGSGMSKEVLRKLFTPFFTTKAVGVGTGLGLAICFRIVASMGGKIQCESELGKGTEFRVLLPAAAEKTPTPAAGFLLFAPPPCRRGQVLVVDDEVIITDTVMRLLKKDHDVRAVNSAMAAHALFHEGKRFDVILCDLMMPQVTGMELHRMLERLDSVQAGKIVFMTGGAFTPAARQFLDVVPNARIEKPFDAQGLRTLINKLVV